MELRGLPWGDPVLINLVQFFEHCLRFVGQDFIERIVADDCHFNT